MQGMSYTSTTSSKTCLVLWNAPYAQKYTAHEENNNKQKKKKETTTTIATTISSIIIIEYYYESSFYNSRLIE